MKRLRRRCQQRFRGACLAASVVLASSYALGQQALHTAEAIHESIVIKNRKVEQRQNVIRVTQGKTVELEFSVDEPAELHLHGYDKLLAVEPGKAGVLLIEATIAGRFPLEAHAFGSGGGRKHVVILYLEVYPR
jgi:hypothetical protein